MFSTKEANKNSKSYLVKEIAFSPDSTKFTVCQKDCIIFIYNIGINWGNKKVIYNKFEQNFPVTVMIWPNKKASELFFDVAEGKVKRAVLKIIRFMLYIQLDLLLLLWVIITIMLSFYLHIWIIVFFVII